MATPRPLHHAFQIVSFPLTEVINVGSSARARTAATAGCIAFRAWLRLDKSAWWVLPGLVSLALFAFLLTRIESAFAGRTFAAYGGVHIAPTPAPRSSFSRATAHGASVCRYPAVSMKESIVAMPRNDMKPAISVTVVRTIDEAVAGS
ncbi:MAG: hypothetical protein OEQ29_02370 [Alphaproteobacteria bacterium]|nr:hypothetical protein [Alphaproteobacteria bacterium]